MVHAIAKITNTSGLRGEVKLRPLSRYSIDYIMTKDLHIGQIENNLSSLKLESKVGDGKKMKFKFQGIDTHTEAKNIVGGNYDDTKGFFIEPTAVLTEDHQYETMTKELFGPLVTIYCFDDENWIQTLKIIDQTSEYALT